MTLSQTQKQPRLEDFLTQTRTRASLIPNPYYETKKTKTKTKTRHVQNKNPIRFYCKEETKQGYDKKMHFKTGVE